ncbi:MAG: RHS repeat-associated core domain-containing protein [Acidimicrobiales bacterium]
MDTTAMSYTYAPTIYAYYQPPDLRATHKFTSLDPALSSTNQPYQYANGDPVNNSDPSGLMSVFSQCSGENGNAAAMCDEAVLFKMDYGPLPNNWLTTLNTVADTVGGAVAGCLVACNPYIVVAAGSFGYAVSQRVASAGNYATPSYIFTTLKGALNIPYVDVYSQSPYNAGSSGIVQEYGVFAYESVYASHNPAYLWFQGMVKSSVVAGVMDKVLAKLGEEFLKYSALAGSRSASGSRPCGPTP